MAAPHAAGANRSISATPWDGRPLAEGTLLIHGEQGVGDEIQFVSCLPDVVPLAKRCVLVCHPRLAKLMARSFPAIAVVGHERKPDHIPPRFRIAIDAQISSGDLPKYMRPSIDAFPRRQRLLSGRSAKAQWHSRFEAPGPGLKVGVSWFGGGTWEEHDTERRPLRSGAICSPFRACNLSTCNMAIVQRNWWPRQDNSDAPSIILTTPTHWAISTTSPQKLPPSIW